VIAATVAYITHVAPFYCLFGLGMTLSFASQGAGPHEGAVLRRHSAHDRGNRRRLVSRSSGSGSGWTASSPRSRSAWSCSARRSPARLLIKPWGPNPPPQP
jgi:hypothetical protein